MLEFNYRNSVLPFLLLIICAAGAVRAQTTPFTYQGKLNDGANPANGNYDIQFKLFDTPTVGTGVQQGPTITNATVAVNAGVFSVALDFGFPAYSGPPRYLEISVRPSGSPSGYTLLSPRSPVSSTPYSVRSLNSSVADTLSSACVGCVTSTQIGSVAGSTITGAVPVASVPAGNGNYIQNTTSPQAATNFNVSGTGSANVLNATAQINIGGSRALSAIGSFNFFAGLNAGRDNTTGTSNSFFGISAGEQNTTGINNTYFGVSAGRFNTTGGFNAFFGSSAGAVNTASQNSFFGGAAGINNSSGDSNAFFRLHGGTI
jgi:hypothetical protein